MNDLFPSPGELRGTGTLSPGSGTVPGACWVLDKYLGRKEGKKEKKRREEGREGENESEEGKLGQQQGGNPVLLPPTLPNSSLAPVP